jgi:hypothetical protein
MSVERQALWRERTVVTETGKAADVPPKLLLVEDPLKLAWSSHCHIEFLHATGVLRLCRRRLYRRSSD